MQLPSKALKRHFRIYAALLAVFLLPVVVTIYNQRVTAAGPSLLFRKYPLYSPNKGFRTGETIPISITPNPGHIPNAASVSGNALKITINAELFDPAHSYVYVNTDGWLLLASSNQQVLLSIYLCDPNGGNWTPITSPRGSPFKVPINPGTRVGQFVVAANRPASQIITKFYTDGSTHPSPDPSSSPAVCSIVVRP